MINHQILNHPAIQRALEEDLGTGDITTDAVVDPAGESEARLLAKQDLVMAGLPVFCRVFQHLSQSVTFESFFRDGQAIPGGRTICHVSGPVSVILKAERTALNFLQRMSGIATLTRTFVQEVGGGKVRILDTRKTAPGLRLLDKYSVRMGGGFNHRIGLFDGVLIKDNHIRAAGTITRAVTLTKERVPHTLKIEVEVTDPVGLEEAILAGADAVLLDNMSVEAMREAVEKADGRVLVEASGNVDLNNVAAIARAGVDLISVGALTHSAKAVDLSLKLI